MEKQMIKHQTIPETVNDRIQLIGQEAETKIKRERERDGLEIRNGIRLTF